jgi:hypothetical protein
MLIPPLLLVKRSGMTTLDGFLEVDCAIKACQAVQVAPKEVGHEDLKRMISSIKNFISPLRQGPILTHATHFLGILKQASRLTKLNAGATRYGLCKQANDSAVCAQHGRGTQRSRLHFKAL